MIKKLFIITFILLFILSNTALCASDPKLVTNINNGLTKIKTWIIKISTPAAAVAIGTGVLMKKFSFGDEERLRIGRKIIRGSLFSYAFLLCIDLILSTINLLLT